VNSTENRKAVIQHWWEKAEESLQSAKREWAANSLTFAMNRIYYAAFYAVSAALFERQISAKKHSGVRAAFHREFVKSTILDTRWGKFYDKLFEDRQEGDYIAFTTFERDYVEEQLRLCEEFLKILKPLIGHLKVKE